MLKQCAVGLLTLLLSAALLQAHGGATHLLGTVSAVDGNRVTIKDKSGNTISKARCEALIGRNVQLANTGFDLVPLMAAGAVCLVGAAAFGMRRRNSHRLS